MSDDCYCDYDMPVCFNEKVVKSARKEHKCGECRQMIAKGSSYHVASGIWDGNFEINKTCLHCRALIDWVTAHVPCFCWSYGTVLSDARELVGEYSPEVPGMWMEFGRLHVKCISRKGTNSEQRYRDSQRRYQQKQALAIRVGAEQ